MPSPDFDHYQPNPTWDHYDLYSRVRDAIYAIPAHFNSATNIEGLAATDIHTLNQVLGATIEDQVVATLNRLRPYWDPDNAYQTYAFYRQAQVFPDVLFKSDRNGEEIILGIELKGWYLLAKEEVPNFRFQTTAAACAPADLLVVVPWALDNVVSGNPMTFKPYIVSAGYAAEYRNYWWSEVRNARGDRHIDSPIDISPYPSSSEQIADRPASDGGGNFGRLARTGMMDTYIHSTLDTPLCGIPTREWVAFLRQFRQ